MVRDGRSCFYVEGVVVICGILWHVALVLHAAQFCAIICYTMVMCAKLCRISCSFAFFLWEKDKQNVKENSTY